MKTPLSFLPYFTPKAVDEQGPLAILRHKTLQTLLIVSLVLGGIWYAARIHELVAAAAWDLAGAATLILVITGGLIVFNQLPLKLRSGLFLALVYGLAVTSLARGGFTATSLVLIFVLAFFTTLFFGVKSCAAALTLLAAGSAAVLVATGRVDEVTAVFAYLGLEGILIAVAVGIVALILILTQILMELEYKKIQARQEKTIHELGDERGSIEVKLQKRTTQYQERLKDARDAVEITRAVCAIQEPGAALQAAVDLIQNRFGLYYVGGFLLDDERQFAMLRAGSGEAGRMMLIEGHRLPVAETSMIGWAISQRKTRVAADAGSEVVRFNNPHLPYTRSEIAVPVLYEGQVTGALTLQSTQPNDFDEDDALLFQSIADGLGVALANARQYQEMRNNLEDVSELASSYLAQAWADMTGGQGRLSSRYENPAAEELENPVEYEFPLTLRNLAIGKITLERDAGALTTEERAFINAVGVQTAIALENARLLEETHRQALEEQKLNELTEQLSQADGIEEILMKTVRQLADLPAVAEASVHLFPAGPDNNSEPAYSGSNGCHPVEAQR